MLKMNHLSDIIEHFIVNFEKVQLNMQYIVSIFLLITLNRYFMNVYAGFWKLFLRNYKKGKTITLDFIFMNFLGRLVLKEFA